jgi:hypothetical protein
VSSASDPVATSFDTALLSRNGFAGYTGKEGAIPEILAGIENLV